MSEERKLDPAWEPEEEQAERPKLSDSDAMKVDMYFWLQALVAALITLILLFTFVGRIIGVDGDSMYPTLHNGDLLLLQSVGYEPRQGDVVVLTKEFDAAEGPIVKRVIAVGGQTVEIDYTTSTVYVDGVPLEEDYILEPMEQPDSPYAQAQGLSELAGATATSQLGTIWYDGCLPQIPDATILTPQESAPAMLMALETGRVNLVVTDIPTAKAALNAYSDFVLLDFNDSEDNFVVSSEDVNIGISVQKGNTELKDAINGVLATMTGSTIGTVYVFAPLAIATCTNLGLDPTAAACAIVVSGWCGHFLPIDGMPAMVMGVGDYNIKEFWKFTIPQYFIRLLALTAGALIVFPM